MKIKIRKEYILWFTLSVLIIIFWYFLIQTITSNQEENKEIYLKSNLVTFDSKVDSTLKTYEMFSKYIFEEIINKDDVLKLVSEANFSDVKSKDLQRNMLYDLLGTKYKRMEEYDFRQLHFHLSNGDSFLRFHAPDKYDDNLIDVRDSIRIVASEHRYVSGFEEGRIYNGYRFVYPLTYNDEYIGSVEVSISMALLVDILYEMYPNMNTYFMIDKNVVHEKVFDTQLGNYSESKMSSQYYVDKEVEKHSNRNINLFSESDLIQFFEGLRPLIKDKLSTKESFVVNIKYNDENYILIFKSIKNIANDSVAYLVSLSKDYQYESMFGGLNTKEILIDIIASLFIFSTFVFVKIHVKLKNVTSVDFLTQINNRHQFLMKAEMEYERYKRNRNPFCILMIDIDHFKDVNDQYGHSSGDMVLKTMAKIISLNLRKNDIFARWGGEEFIILVPDLNSDEGEIVGNKIRKLVSDYEFLKVGYITISIGLASIEENDKIESQIEKADEALYRAKKAGRNKVCVYK